MKEKRNMYLTPQWRKWRRKFNNELMDHQVEMLDAMLDADKLTGAYPTGTGKSRIIYGDILEHIEAPEPDVFIISSHRLLLNVQHLKEVFETFEPALSNIGFIFVGSHQIDITRFNQNVDNNRFLSELKMNYKDLLSTETSNKGLKDKVKKHINHGRDVIIISTYHSLHKLKGINVHSFYADEAHTLASPSVSSMFKENFEHVKAKRNYFFTATPKDAQDANERNFLMNNESIFGKRKGISFRLASEKGLIVKPKIHLVETDQLDENRTLVSGSNYAKVIIDTFKVHEKVLKKESADFSQVAPKVLIKCPSVKDIWEIREELRKTYSGENVQVFAGASWSDSKLDESFYHNGDDNGLSKIEFLERIQALRYDEKAIILHYDILTEGIDVPGITGVMFLSKNLPSIMKVVQTIGRSTRLHLEDRRRLYIKKLAIEDKEKWIKPYCYVMLPVLTNDMYSEYLSIKDTIQKLRSDFDFTPEIIVSEGEDISFGNVDKPEKTLNETKKSKAFTTIRKIFHSIEEDIENEKAIFDNDKNNKNFKKKIIKNSGKKLFIC